MTSGGARARSGPAPDPMALRRDRKDDKAWIDLPVEPLVEVPGCPLPELSSFEAEVWADLWSKPQAHMWGALGLVWQVAAYVRAFCESIEPKATAGLKTAVLRQEAELGLSTPGMSSLRWRFAIDELTEKRVEDAPKKVVSARDRMKALNG